MENRRQRIVDTIGPNQALQPTATRCAFTFSMTKTIQMFASRAPGSRG
jgi:hypothetical protein